MILDAKISDIKRQIEVAAKISEKNRQLTQYDLACEFGVSEARIRRDVAVLNKNGMDIHSRKGRYSIHAPDELICRLTRWYLCCARPWHRTASLSILSNIPQKHFPWSLALAAPSAGAG